MIFEKKGSLYIFSSQITKVNTKVNLFLLNLRIPLLILTKINGTPFLFMFTLKFTTVRFFNVSELRSRISSRTQISTKKNEVLGATFCAAATGTPGVVTSILVGNKSLGMSIKIYIMEFSQEKSLEDIVRIL